MRNRLHGLCLLPAFLITGLLLAQSPEKLEVLRVTPGVYMLASPAGNAALQVGTQPGNDGVLLVDTLPSAMTSAVLAEIRKLSDRPIRYIVNTSADAAHIGGNAVLAQSGRPVAAFRIGLAQDGASVFAQDNVLKRMSGPGPAPSTAWPTLTYAEGRDFYFNAEPVQLFHAAAAHTDGDTIVFFRNANVIAAGDVFMTTGYPVIDLKRGGGIEGELAALNRILELAIPADNEEGGTMIIPGHGRLCDEADVSDYRDMITIIRDRVADLVKKNQTLEQVKAAQPTLDYDGRYSRPEWTGDMFVESIFNSLKNGGRK